MFSRVLEQMKEYHFQRGHFHRGHSVWLVSLNIDSTGCRLVLVIYHCHLFPKGHQ